MNVQWGEIKGRRVFEARLVEESQSGFSVWGTRTLLLTDHPAVYAHDTGGLGTEYVTALEPAAEPAAVGPHPVVNE